MPLRQYIRKHTVSLYVVVLVIFQLLLSFQGFDVCDEGFSLTFYQQFFNAPASVEYNFGYWLSGLVGGVWYQLFPEGGILWFRILAIIFNTSTLIIAYKLLKPYLNRQVLMVALAMVLFVNDYGFIVFYHNTITAFLVVLASYFLIKGLEKQSLYFIALSAFICAMNIFSRLPNATMLIAILVIPYYGALNKHKLNLSLKKMAVYVLGAILGLSVGVLLLYVLGQTQIMNNAIEGILDSGSSSGSSHSFSNLFEAYWMNTKAIARQLSILVPLALVMILMRYIVESPGPFKYGKYVSISFWLIGGTVIFFLLFIDKGIYSLYAVIVLATLVSMTQKRNASYKTLVLLAFLIALILPFGSDRGVWNSGYMSIWMALPIALSFFYDYSEQLSKIKFLKKYGLSYKQLGMSFLVAIGMGFLGAKAHNISQQAYFDPGNRLDKTYAINSKFTKGIYTTQQRAEVINELLPKLQEYVKPNDTLLAYQSLPMLHFLTETKPYLKNPWVWIYDGEIFEKQLKEAQSDSNTLPIVVRQKFETLSEFSAPIPDYFSEEKEDTYSNSAQRNKAMNTFLAENNYEIVWSNAYFNIYKPK